MNTIKVLRAFQVINQDGQFMVSATYNEIDATTGQIVKANAKTSFYAMEDSIRASITDTENYILSRLTAE